MFMLIGISYLVAGYIWDTKLTKLILILCGLYLIAMNFTNNFDFKSIIGIVCILVPILMIRFSPDEADDEELAES